jgi:SAM-dependent methyltransferase
VEHHTLKSWQNRQFALDWAANDQLADFLQMPRELSAAVVGHTRTSPSLIIDIASGPGAYLEVYLDRFPEAHGVWTDGSEVMREQAMRRLARFGDRVRYDLVDMTDVANAGLPTGADAVITSRASHHLLPAELVRFYRGLAGLLAPGGWVANLDHTDPGEPWLDVFKAVKPLFTGPAAPRPGHAHTQSLPRLGDQLDALRAAGLRDGEVVWKSFQTVLLMGRVA